MGWLKQLKPYENWDVFFRLSTGDFEAIHRMLGLMSPSLEWENLGMVLIPIHIPISGDYHLSPPRAPQETLHFLMKYLPPTGHPVAISHIKPYGAFHKWRYPQSSSISNDGIFHDKASILRGTPMTMEKSRVFPYDDPISQMINHYEPSFTIVMNHYEPL